MTPTDIVEGGSYTDDPNKQYFRQVVAIYPANPIHWPGRYRVNWTTDGFPVEGKQGPGRSHGRCFLETFAKWAKYKL